MLPQNRASTLPIPGLSQPGDDARSVLLVDQELGGVAINDASQGLSVQLWTISYAGVNVTLTSQSGSSSVLFSAAAITELALSFDQNMRPTVAYRQGGNVFLRWWDTTEAAYVVTDFGPGFSPRLCLDDRRPSQIGNSDVIFAYIRSGALYYRQQRDRYEVERMLRNELPPSTRLKSVGMNRNWRLQFELI